MSKIARRNAKHASKGYNDDRMASLSFENNSLASAPKHVALPNLPPESELAFESQTMLLFIVSMASQYLNLYRTVWWLSSSHTNTIINFHLIDLNVVIFSLLLMGRSFFQQLSLIPINMFIRSSTSSVSTSSSLSSSNLVSSSTPLSSVSPSSTSSSMPSVSRGTTANVNNSILTASNHTDNNSHKNNNNNSAMSNLNATIVSSFNTKSSLILLVCSLVTCVCFIGMARCMYYIYLNHGITGILSIWYPLIIYLLMYFPNLLASYESYNKILDVYFFLDLFLNIIKPIEFSTQQPVHCCSSSTIHIRDEVDRLKSSFNSRLKFILFRSLIISYYSSFVPLCLVQPQLLYDVTWTAQHVAISWLSAFLLLTSHLYSPHFYDILHKSSLHLGKWQRLETRNTLVPCSQWCDKYLYAQGVVVRYSREYFKAEGVANCAEPGNQSHLRYYIVFSNPIGGFGTLLGLLVLLMLAMIVLLVRSIQWYKFISMSLLIIVNSITVFRLVRSYYVLGEVYKVEAQLQDSNFSQ